jgi:arylsulfatase A-like enzyme
MARRLVERGVRFVQVWSGAGGPSNNWDNHASIARELPPMARATDQPTAALLADLAARGLLEDTLVVWCTEFGRQPFTQGSDGRDHNGGTSVAWLAGAGVRGGVAHGESDEWGWQSIVPMDCHDLHATILHLLGIDHERLTFRHNGSDRRLTDVHGNVIHEVLA